MGVLPNEQPYICITANWALHQAQWRSGITCSCWVSVDELFSILVDLYINNLTATICYAPSTQTAAIIPEVNDVWQHELFCLILSVRVKLYFLTKIFYSFYLSYQICSSSHDYNDFVILVTYFTKCLFPNNCYRHYSKTFSGDILQR